MYIYACMYMCMCIYIYIYMYVYVCIVCVQVLEAKRLAAEANRKAEEAKESAQFEMMASETSEVRLSCVLEYSKCIYTCVPG